MVRPELTEILFQLAAKRDCRRTEHKAPLRNSLLYFDLMLYRPKVIGFRTNIYSRPLNF